MIIRLHIRARPVAAPPVVFEEPVRGTLLEAAPTIFGIRFGIYAMPVAANFGWPTLDTAAPAIIMIIICIYILALPLAAGPVCGASVPAPPAVDFIGQDITFLALARMAALVAETVVTATPAVVLIGLGIKTWAVITTLSQARWAYTIAILTKLRGKAVWRVSIILARAITKADPAIG
jgi:hypothetical protein